LINASDFDKLLKEELNIGAYAGVPDSVLKHFCDYLYGAYGISKQHLICANEGNCIAFGVGAYLATGKIPCVYMQNSGLGNAVNPLLSLSSPEVYRIPLMLLVGWRGAAGEKDEPQHISQGRRTSQMLELIDIPYETIDGTCGISDVREKVKKLNPRLSEGQSVAFLVKKNVFLSKGDSVCGPRNGIAENTCTPPHLIREKALRRILERYPKDLFVATTGVTSRELFEMRDSLGQGHSNDFLNVGAMGHASAIALGLALHHSAERVWCLDGDGAALMHMGAMAVIGANAAKNLVHVLFNNEAHESVGGLPTVGGSADFVKTARACGYEKALRVESEDDLSGAFRVVDTSPGLIFMEIKIKIGSRADLGRPNLAPTAGKEAFINRIRGQKEETQI
jgi:phosphonopyruvate decarboxylase